MAKKNKGKADVLKQTIGNIERRFGKGSVMWLGSDEAKVNVDTIPTGSLTLDAALGIGGVPRGRIVEIYGPEASGKTTIVLQIVAQAQKRGGLAAIIDAEHALDPIYARNLGVNLDDLLISQPDTGEQALEIAEELVRSGALDLVAIDSVAALVPRAELEGEMGDSHMGLQARLMSQALRKLAGAINKSNTCLILTNQLRMKIGVFFGNPETTTGGRALKFYASVRIDIRRSSSIKEGDDIIGNTTTVKVVKNKLAPPFKKAEFDILYGKGISRETEILNLAVDNDIIDRRGTWYSYGEEKLGQGRSNATTFLMENPDIMDEVEVKIREKLGLPIPNRLEDAKEELEKEQEPEEETKEKEK
jgi:recombination protein RecA